MNREVCSIVLQRWEVIESLRNETKDKRTLVEDLDCSRSTVNRAIRELESMGLVEYVNGEYTVTPLGETIANGFEDLMDTVDIRLHLEPFLQWIPNDEPDLDLKHLQDAKLLLPQPGDPWAMINRHVTVLSQADDIRCVLPLVGLHGQEVVHKQVVNNGARAEIIVTPDVVQTLQADPAYAGMTEDMVATGRYHLYRYEDQIPYFIGCLDDIVQMGADEDGEPRALVESDNIDVRNWAEQKLEKFKREAEPVEVTAETTKLRS